MSLPRLVVTLLAEKGDLTPVQLAPYCDGFTHDQIRKALQNAARKHQCHVLRKERHPRLRGWVAVWRHGPAPTREPVVPGVLPRGEYAWIGPVSSVWDLSLRA